MKEGSKEEWCQLGCSWPLHYGSHLLFNLIKVNKRGAGSEGRGHEISRPAPFVHASLLYASRSALNVM
jgi:polyferredoxin